MGPANGLVISWALLKSIHCNSHIAHISFFRSITGFIFFKIVGGKIQGGNRQIQSEKT
jgi:hypothetical protein